MLESYGASARESPQSAVVAHELPTVTIAVNRAAYFSVAFVRSDSDVCIQRFPAPARFAVQLPGHATQYPPPPGGPGNWAPRVQITPRKALRLIWPAGRRF